MDKGLTRVYNILNMYGIMRKYYSKEDRDLACYLQHTRLFNVWIRCIWKEECAEDVESEDGRRKSHTYVVRRYISDRQIRYEEIETSPILRALDALHDETEDLIRRHPDMHLSYDPVDLTISWNNEGERIVPDGEGGFEGKVTVVVRFDVQHRAHQYIFGVHPSRVFQYVQPQSQGWPWITDEQKANREDLQLEDMDDEQYAKYYPFMKVVEDVLREEGHLDPDFELPEPE